MLIHNILNLFFPKLCGACSKLVIRSHDELCLKCELNLIDEARPESIKIKKVLRGRADIERGAFFLDFKKREETQKILHSIKYQNQKKLGIYISEQLSLKLSADFFEGIDCVVPVPLHPKKLKLRGFNQRSLIARGIHNTKHIPIDFDHLKRVKNTSSQTNKNSLERWKNVKSAFKVINANAFQEKHILLVDDVFTTGATLEACVNTIQKQVKCKCSILTLARASKINY